jgi:drug/metabolite transporter (DMT)-like permease
MELAGASVVLLPVAFTTAWGRADAGDVVALVVLGLVHTGAGMVVYLSALGRIPATHVGILGYLEPVSVVVLSWLVLGDVPSPVFLAGAALIVTAGVLVIRAAPASTPAPPVTPEVPVRVPG